MGWSNRRNEWQRRIRESLGPVGTFFYVLSMGTLILSGILLFLEDWANLSLKSWMFIFIVISIAVFLLLNIVFYVRYKIIQMKTSKDGQNDRVSYPTSYTDE